MNALGVVVLGAWPFDWCGAPWVSVVLARYFGGFWVVVQVLVSLRCRDSWGQVLRTQSWTG